MATKFAQDSVHANSNHYRHCDVTVTCMTSLWHHLFLNVSLRSSKAINLLNTVPEEVKIPFLVERASIIYFLNVYFWNT